MVKNVGFQSEKMVGILRKGMLFSSFVDRVYAGVEATFAWILLAFMLS